MNNERKFNSHLSSIVEYVFSTFYELIETDCELSILNNVLLVDGISMDAVKSHRLCKMNGNFRMKNSTDNRSLDTRNEKPVALLPSTALTL